MVIWAFVLDDLVQRDFSDFDDNDDEDGKVKMLNFFKHFDNDAQVIISHNIRA